MQLLSEKRLEFVDAGDNSHFVTADQIHLSVFEFDQHIMLPLENLGALANRGLIDIELAYEFFAWHVALVWDSEAVQDYIAWARSDPNDDGYFYCLEALSAAFATCEQVGKHKCKVAK